MNLFYEWAEQCHYDKRWLPKLPEFSQRRGEMFPRCRSNSKTNRFRGISIATADPVDAANIEADLRRQESYMDTVKSEAMGGKMLGEHAKSFDSSN